MGTLDWPPSLARHFESELRAHFTEAWVTGFEPLIAQMTNDPKDRHVAAAVVHCRASAILTFNLRDFSDTALAPWGVRPTHPQIFLTDLPQREPDLVKSKLQQQAADRNRTLLQLLQVLAATVPEFASAVLATIRR